MLYLTDRQGLPLVLSGPVAGNHNDFYNIEARFEVVTATREGAGIPMEGLFMNADSGFDSREFREIFVQKEINANICVPTNDRATGTGMNILTRNLTMKDMP